MLGKAEGNHLSLQKNTDRNIKIIINFNSNLQKEKVIEKVRGLKGHAKSVRR
jgi:hypothetical protein